MPPETALAAAAVALPFAGAAATAALRGAGRDGAQSRWVAVACSVATALVVALLWLGFAEPVAWRVEWIPAAGIGFGAHIDGLRLFFAVLVAGLGLLVTLYSAAYVPQCREGRGRSSGPAAVYAYLLLFQGSMLGLVVSASLIQFYIFWELLDIAAFLLVGLDWRSRRARGSATTVLLFTTLGGLALLLGIVLIGTATGSFWIADVVARAELLHASAALVPAMLLVLVAAVAKSAQFPLYVWLPRAMAAPTPVNALDDSVLVPAAGVFLLVLVHPVFAPHPLWGAVLVTAGFASILVAGLLALQARELKVLLAYSTISQFGFAFVLLGYGGGTAVAAALFLVFHHALLKCGLFLSVGTVGFAAGRWEVGGMGTARGRMPLLFAAACVLAASLAGVPPLGGFWSKEYFLKSTLGVGGPLLVAVAVVGSALTVVYMLRWLFGSFAGDAERSAQWRHPPALLVLIPAVLAGLTLLLGAFPGWVADALVNPAAVAAVDGSPQVDPALELGTVLLLSVLALVLGLLGFLAARSRGGMVRTAAEAAGTVERVYPWVARGVSGAGRWSLRLQNGSLLRYTTLILLALLGLVGYAVVVPVEGGAPPLSGATTSGLDWRLTALLLLTCAGALLTLLLREHLQMVLALGAVGYLIAGVFALALAPNLGLLQVHVETLVTVLLVLPLAAIPREVRERLFVATRERVTAGRLGLAAMAGVGAAWVSWRAIEHLPSDPIAPWFNENAPVLVDATDVVAAVLIHFRALDTLGEIIVFGTAAIGVLALSHLIREHKQ